MKKFLISIDTEGDNLWIWKHGNVINTKNVDYLPRFQNLCEEFGYKPTYLTNYEIANSKDYQKFAKNVIKKKTGEVGMHLHAWNTPPEDRLENQKDNPGAAYLIEYNPDIMEEKISFMTEKLRSVFETDIITHRAGRWTMNETYFNLLANYNYKIDCSVTPHIDWKKCTGETTGSGGSNYKHSPENPYFLKVDGKSLLEVPLTVRRTQKTFKSSSAHPYLSILYRKIAGNVIWLRPNGNNTNKMLWLIDKIANEDNTDYIMFMLHSSELMPGGSPTFKTEESIEVLYGQLKTIFEYASDRFEGMTIGEYGTKKILSEECK